MELVPDGGMHLASALKKIEGHTAPRDKLGGANSHLAHMYIANNAKPGRERWGAALFSTHPRTADRVAYLVPTAEDMAEEGEPAPTSTTAFSRLGNEVAGVLEDGLW